MNKYTILYATDPEIDACGCCVCWDAALLVKNADGKVVHSDYNTLTELVDFAQVLDFMGAFGVMKMFPGEYVADEENRYYSDERHDACLFGEGR